jgi:phospholipid/cholesterol/gamma-HCH transport system substrate-binding protein
LIGEKYIDISMGSQDQPFLPDGSTVIGVDPVSVGEMLSTAEVITRKFEGALTTLNKMLGGEKTREKIGKILLNTVLLTSNLNTVVAENRERVEKAFSDLSEVSTNIITLTDDIEKLSLEVKGVIKENRKDIRVACKKFREASLSLKKLEEKLHTLVDESGARLRNASNTFERASANLERITSEAGEEVGGILSEWREITNENKAKINSILTDLREVSRELRGSAESLNLIAKKIKSGEGVIGKLIYDDEIANDLTQTANSFRELAEELKRSPWKLLRKE